MIVIIGCDEMKMIKYIDKWLLLVSTVLFVIGLVMVFSSSNVAAFMRYSSSPYRFVIRQTVFLAVGVIFSFIAIRFSTKFYGFISWPGLLAITVVLALVLLYGKLAGGAVSWIEIGPFRFQPSEFAKVIMIVWMASFYDINRNKLNKYSTSLFPLILCAIIVGLLMLQPDLGTAIIFAGIVGFIFLTVPIDLKIKYRTILIVIGFAVLGGIILVSKGGNLFFQHQIERFNFTNPCSEEKFYDQGNQVCNGYIAINNGGLFGKGLGNSTQKYLYLPDSHTDFIFPIVVEELGLLFGLFLIFLYVFLLARIMIIAHNSYNSRNAIMCYGVAFYIFLHIVINLMGVMGMMPMTGVPLPFLSYGGSFTICLVVALTIVQRVAIENNTKKLSKKEGNL